VIKPKVLLLDEPLSALDAKIRKNIQFELRKIQQELQITTIFVTHDQEEALILSDQVIIMDQGHVVQEGTPEEVYTNPKNEFVARFIGSYNVVSGEELKQLLKIDFGAKQYAIRPEVIQLLPGHEKHVADDNYWFLDGLIQEIKMMGNVLRYTIKLNDEITIFVDHLHRNDQRWNQGTHIKVSIPKSECIPL